MKCSKCYKEIYCWYTIKRKPFCIKCSNEFFSWLKDTKTEDLKKMCSCCKNYGKIVYEDSKYPNAKKNDILLCEPCYELFNPPLEIKLKQKRENGT